MLLPTRDFKIQITPSARDILIIGCIARVVLLQMVSPIHFFSTYLVIKISLESLSEKVQNRITVRSFNFSKYSVKILICNITRTFANIAAP